MTGRSNINALILFLGLMGALGTVCSAEMSAISLELPSDKRVSLAIYNKEGKQIRTLMNAKPLSAGTQHISWDGLDKSGKAVPPGVYHYKALASDGIKAEYIFSLGANNNSTPLWLGNHRGPAAVAVRNGFVYAGAGMTEGPPAFLKMTMDGKVIWTRPWCEAWGGISSINLFEHTHGKTALKERHPEGTLYIAHPRTGNVYMADSRDGKPRHLDHLLADRERGRLAPPLAEQVITLEFVEKKDHDNSQQLDISDNQSGQIRWSNTAGLETGKDPDGKEHKEHLLVTTSRQYNINSKVNSSFHAYSPANGKGTGEPSHVLTIPAGKLEKAIIEVVIGHPERDLDQVCLFAGLKRDRPDRRKVLSVKAGEVKRVELGEVASHDNMFFISLGNAKDKKAGWAVREIVIRAPYTRMDSGFGRLVMGEPVTGTIAELAPDSLKTINSKRIPGLVDVAVIGIDQTLILTANGLLLIKGNEEKLFAADFAEAERFAVCPKSGDIFIYMGGETQQIFKYDKNFHKIAEFGRQGGRLQGEYNPEDFAGVSDIAADEHGGFIITEPATAPRRLARFSGDGKLVWEWYGGQPFFAHVCQDPKMKDRFWFESGASLVEVQADWNNKSWKILRIYDLPQVEDITLGRGHYSSRWKVRWHNDKQYFLHAQCIVILEIDTLQNRLVPVVYSYFDRFFRHRLDTQPALVRELAGHNSFTPDSYIWNDLNRNQRIDKDELRFFRTFFTGGHHCSVNEDFSYGKVFTQRDDNNNTSLAYTELKLEKWVNDIPVYSSFDSAPVVLLELDSSIKNHDGSLMTPGVFGENMVDQEGSVYSTLKGKGDGFVAKDTYDPAHGVSWPSNAHSATRFAKWSNTGELLWSVGSLATSVSDFRARLHDPVKILGKVNGCIAVGNRIVNPAEFWTYDGLYVGGVFDRRADDGLPDAYYTWFRADGGTNHSYRQFDVQAKIQHDMLAGGLVSYNQKGEVIFMGSGGESMPTYRLTGWDSFKRMAGNVKVEKTMPTARNAGTGLNAEYFESLDLSGAPTFKSLDSQIWFGNLGNIPKPWPKTKVTKQAGFSGRWYGYLEPKFSENYIFRIYTARGRRIGQGLLKPEKVRLWIDGNLVIDNWHDSIPRKQEVEHDEGVKHASKPIFLRAGMPIPIKIEYLKVTSGDLHLCWESETQQIEHIPTHALYPEKP